LYPLRQQGRHQPSGLLAKARLDTDARQAPTASSLSLLGLLKHCALWERRWFQNIVAGRSFPGEFPELEVPEDEMDAEDFRVDERDTVEHWVASFNEQADRGRS
jgi:uncharacterized damage-inducible protein DinB